METQVLVVNEVGLDNDHLIAVINSGVGCLRKMNDSLSEHFNDKEINLHLPPEERDRLNRADKIVIDIETEDTDAMISLQLMTVK